MIEPKSRGIRFEEIHVTKDIDPETLIQLGLRAERLRQEYQRSETVFQRNVKDREAFMEIGAEVLKRSNWRLSKKTTRAVGSAGLTGWRGSDEFRRFETEADALVRETESILTRLKGRKPSLRMVHEAVMPDTKLRHLIGVLVTAEQRSQIIQTRSSHRASAKRSRVRQGKVAVRTETRKKRGTSHIQTLVGIGTTAIFGFAGLVWILRFGLVESVLLLAIGTGGVLAITDALLIRFSR